MTKLAVGTILVLAAVSALAAGCFGPGPGYDHRDVVYVDHSHDHPEQHDDHHDEHRDDRAH
jgi:hypothetical protein